MGNKIKDAFIGCFTLIVLVLGVGGCTALVFGGGDDEESPKEEKPKTEQKTVASEEESEPEEDVEAEEEKKPKSKEDKEKEKQYQLFQEELPKKFKKEANFSNINQMVNDAQQTLIDAGVHKNFDHITGKYGKRQLAYDVGQGIAESGKVSEEEAQKVLKEFAQSVLDGAIEKPSSDEVRVKQIAIASFIQNYYPDSQASSFAYKVQSTVEIRFLEKEKPNYEREKNAKELASKIIYSFASVGEKNAAETAYSYLQMSGFSRKDLQGQLEYEKFTPSEVQFALKAIDGVADWNEEAAESAQSYMEFSSMSAQELYEQLIYDGFTAEQASFGVKSVGY